MVGTTRTASLRTFIFTFAKDIIPQCYAPAATSLLPGVGRRLRPSAGALDEQVEDDGEEDPLLVLSQSAVYSASELSRRHNAPPIKLEVLGVTMDFGTHCHNLRARARPRTTQMC